MWGPLSVEDPTTIDLSSLNYDILILLFAGTEW